MASRAVCESSFVVSFRISGDRLAEGKAATKQQPPDLANGHRAMTIQPPPRAMKRPGIALFAYSVRHERDAGRANSGANVLGVIAIVLLV